jgi:serine/threonine protein kinase
VIEHQFHQKFEFIKVLGRGSSAEVHLCRLKSNPSQEYAVKIVKKDYDHSINDSKSMKTEATIMKLLHSQHVIQMYELYETESTIWMILEHANGGDLMHGLASLSQFNEKNIAKIFYQLLLGMKYLHSQGIIHRDLKMDNLLYSTSSDSSSTESADVSADNIQLKIADFGLSAILSTKRTNENSKSLKSMKSLKEMWGTVEYFAPEVYHRSYGYQADIWALGCILYEMLVGEVAFPSRETDSTFFEKVMKTGTLGKAKSKRSFEYHSNYQVLSSSVKSLIKGMLKRNPKKRFDIDECLSHPWIQEALQQQGEQQQKGEAGYSHKTSASVASSSSVTVAVLPTFYEVELIKTKKVISERATRRRKRYETLVKEIERAQRRDRAIAAINV